MKNWFETKKWTFDGLGFTRYSIELENGFEVSVVLGTSVKSIAIALVKDQKIVLSDKNEQIVKENLSKEKVNEICEKWNDLVKSEFKKIGENYFQVPGATPEIIIENIQNIIGN